MTVECMGNTTLNLNEKISVNEVLYVPDLVANLLSVYKIFEKGNTVVFNK